MYEINTSVFIHHVLCTLIDDQLVPITIHVRERADHQSRLDPQATVYESMNSCFEFYSLAELFLTCNVVGALKHSDISDVLESSVWCRCGGYWCQPCKYLCKVSLQMYKLFCNTVLFVHFIRCALVTRPEGQRIWARFLMAYVTSWSWVSPRPG